MAVTAADVSKLRKMTGAGMMDCKNALEESNGNFDQAVEIIRKRGQLVASKRADRDATEGVVIAKASEKGNVGAMIVLNCETDFVARTNEFKELAHHLAMQVAAMCPRFILEEEVPEGDEVEVAADCLLSQPYIKDPSITIQDIIVATIAKVGENIKVSRFARFELGK